MSLLKHEASLIDAFVCVLQVCPRYCPYISFVSFAIWSFPPVVVQGPACPTAPSHPPAHTPPRSVFLSGRYLRTENCLHHLTDGIYHIAITMSMLFVHYISALSASGGKMTPASPLKRSAMTHPSHCTALCWRTTTAPPVWWRRRTQQVGWLTSAPVLKRSVTTKCHSPPVSAFILTMDQMTKRNVKWVTCSSDTTHRELQLQFPVSSMEHFSIFHSLLRFCYPQLHYLQRTKQLKNTVSDQLGNIVEDIASKEASTTSP